MNYQRYGQALKYAAESSSELEGLLRALHAAPAERAPLRDYNETDPRTLRGVTKDALIEHNRYVEANLLADPGQHVVIENGRVYPGQMSLTPIRDHLHDIYTRLDNLVNGPEPQDGTEQDDEFHAEPPDLDDHAYWGDDDRWHAEVGHHGHTWRTHTHLSDLTNELHGHIEDAVSAGWRHLGIPLRERHQHPLYHELSMLADEIHDSKPQEQPHYTHLLYRAVNASHHPDYVPPAHYARKASIPAPPTSTDTAALFRALATTHKHELTDSSGRGIIRAVLADVLQEEGRDGEATAARSTDPIAIHHGRIWSGNYDSLPASAQEYVRTALGLQPYRGGMMDEYVDPRDLHPNHIARLHADWVTFAAAHEKFPGEIAPHHFHLSRNQDGGGFEDHPEEYGDKRSVKLEAAARQYGIHRLSRPQRQPPSQTI